MGKVMINKTDATKTARNGSSDDSRPGVNKQERAHIDLSRKVEQTDHVGVKVSNTKKNDTGAAKSRALPAKVSTGEKSATTKVKVNTSAREDKALARANAASHAASAQAAKSKNSQKSNKITKFAQPASQKTAIIEKSIPVNAKNNSGSASSAKKSSAQSEMGLVLRGRDIDPEIALMESRARAMERPKPEVLNRAQSNGRSVSGMVNNGRGRVRNNGTANTRVAVDPTKAQLAEVADEEPQLSKAKSMLIGVGVALVVAVVGFAGIALFGNDKPMCAVHFESNGGSEVEDTEIICGRVVERPEDPEKEGFTFEGWILDGDPFDFNENSIYKDSTLVAKWKANEGTEVVKVKFDTDGGSAISDIELAKGRTITRPKAPTKMGYVLVDWYLGDKVFDFDTPINEDITLKAKWERRASTNTNNNVAQDNKRVTSMSVTSGSITLEKGQLTTVSVKIIPSAADYSLAVSSSNEDVATCSVNKAEVSCTAKNAGTAKISVRDVNSGNRAEFTIVVPDQTPPEVQDPDPEKPENPNPENPEEPDPETPDPNKPDPSKPDPDNPDPEKPENPNPENPNPDNPDPQPENPDPENPDPTPDQPESTS